MKKTTWEIRLWHGFGKTGFERWVTPTEPQILPTGAVQFTCSDNNERYVIGAIEVVKRP